MKKITLLIDLDDTLVWTNYLYNLASARVTLLLARLVCPHTPNISEFLKRYGRIDLENARQFGFGDITRFGSSWVETARYFFKQYNLEFTKFDEKQIRKAANTFMPKNYKLMSGVRETLEYFSSKKDRYNLILLTAGEKGLQTYKLDNVNIKQYFSKLHIVPHKNVQTYKQIIKDNGLSKKHTYMIGNSKKSDIYPAINSGINAIYIKTASWKFDEDTNVSSKNYFRVKEFKNLISFFENLKED